MWNSAHLPVHPSRPIKRPFIRHCWQLLALRSNKGLPKPKTTDSDCRSHSKNSMTFIIPCHPVNHRNPFRSKYIYDHASVEREFSLASVGRQNLTPVLRHATSPSLRSKWSASGPAECRLHADLPLGGSRPRFLRVWQGYSALIGYAYPWESRTVLHKASGLNRTHRPVSPDRPDLDRLCIVTHIASTNGVFNFARKTGEEV